MDGVFNTLDGEWEGFKAPFAHVITVDGDLIVQMRQYTDTALVHAAWK